MIQVVLAVTQARRTALVAAGLAIPTPVIATLLIDTGASMTSIDKTLIAKLGLQPTGVVGINTPTTGTTPHQCSTYDVDIIIPATTAAKHLPALPVVESDFSAQGHHGLIGRDILTEFRLTYSGPDKIVWLSY